MRRCGGGVGGSCIAHITKKELAMIRFIKGFFGAIFMLCTLLYYIIIVVEIMYGPPYYPNLLGMFGVACMAAFGYIMFVMAIKNESIF